MIIRLSRAAITLFAAMLVGCHEKRVPPPPTPGLVAALERPEEILVVRRVKDEWLPEKHLPKVARALRFSPNGGAVAWVQDEKGDGGLVPTGYVQGWGADKPESLGRLGLRTRAAMGLAVGNNGEVSWLSEDGELKLLRSKLPTLGGGSEAIAGPAGEWAFVNRNGCLAATDNLVLPTAFCGGAVRPLQYGDGTLLARDNTGLLMITRTGASRLPLSDVLDARLRKQVILALRRVNDGGRVAEAVFLLRDPEPLREVTRGPVIVSAGFDVDGGLLVVRAPSRNSVYQVMLAHAPEEFGGETLPGHAYRYSPAHLQESEVPGLELERVRALFYAR